MKYEKPEMKLIVLEMNDILTVSVVTEPTDTVDKIGGF